MPSWIYGNQSLT
jgi:hypothetical protein